MPAPPLRWRSSGGGQAADVAPIVVAPEQRHIVRHAHAILVIVLHFLVERPELRDDGGVRLENLRNDFALGGHDFFEQRDVVALGHRRVNLFRAWPMVMMFS